MVFLAVIIGLLFIALIILCIQWNDNEETYGFGVFCGCLIGGLFSFEIILICESVYELQPKAMDVYQGKTTLEYTIIDGIKVDSVVIFKENNYGND